MRRGWGSFGLVVSGIVLASSEGVAQTVSTEPQLRQAIANAAPGATLTLLDGIYVLSEPLIPSRAGTSANPITVRAANTNGAVIETSGSEEAFRLAVPYWRFEGLRVRVMGSGSFHGYKLEGNGHHIEIRGGAMELFPGAESGVKGAGGSNAPQPDFALIEGTEIWFTAPTTYFLAEGIDAVAVQGWIIRGNVIHDIRTSAGGVAYGAFTKGNSRDTIIEGNLFYDCFIPISLGGGGTAPQYVRDGDTTYEDRDGLVRNNIAIQSDDVALYLYATFNARVYNNTFYSSFTSCGTGCSSIDVRLATSTADIRNNILDKRIQDRDGATHAAASNSFLSFPTDGAWFVDATQRNFRLRAGAPPIDQGQTLALVAVDFDGHARPAGAAYDIGASEFIAVTADADAGIAIDSGTAAQDDGSAGTADAGAQTPGEGPDAEQAPIDGGVFDGGQDANVGDGDRPRPRADAEGIRSQDPPPDTRIVPGPVEGESDRGSGRPILKRSTSGGCRCVTPRKDQDDLCAILLMLLFSCSSPLRRSGIRPGSTRGARSPTV